MIFELYPHAGVFILAPLFWLVVRFPERVKMFSGASMRLGQVADRRF
jgi:hypothetical protein